MKENIEEYFTELFPDKYFVTQIKTKSEFDKLINLFRKFKWFSPCKEECERYDFFGYNRNNTVVIDWNDGAKLTIHSYRKLLETKSDCRIASSKIFSIFKKFIIANRDFIDYLKENCISVNKSLIISSDGGVGAINVLIEILEPVLPNFSNSVKASILAGISPEQKTFHLLFKYSDRAKPKFEFIKNREFKNNFNVQIFKLEEFKKLTNRFKNGNFREDRRAYSDIL